jgi:hypothetical protein
MSEEQQLAQELESILGRVSEISSHLDQIIHKEREDRKIAWRTRLSILFGITTQI